MASYVFLMQFANQTELTDSDLKRLKVTSEIGGAMTLISCVISLSLLCLLPIKSEGLFITGNLCVVLMAAQLSFIGSENTGYPDPTMCKIATALIHYFFLCVQFGALTYALHLWSKFGPGCLAVWRTRGSYLVIIYILPMIAVLFTVITRGHLYAKDDRCWLPEEDETRLGFLLPVGIIQTVNGFLYVVVLRYTAYLDKTKGMKTVNVLRHLAKTSLSLVPMLGLQWSLGFSITFDGPKSVQYAYVILASTQGLLILMFHVMANVQVQRALCERMAVKGSDVTSTPPPTEARTVDSTVDSKADTLADEATYKKD